MKETLFAQTNMLGMAPILMTGVFISLFMMFVSVFISCGLMLFTVIMATKRRVRKR